MGLWEKDWQILNWNARRGSVHQRMLAKDSGDSEEAGSTLDQEDQQEHQEGRCLCNES